MSQPRRSKPTKPSLPAVDLLFSFSLSGGGWRRRERSQEIDSMDSGFWVLGLSGDVEYHIAKGSVELQSFSFCIALDGQIVRARPVFVNMYKGGLLKEARKLFDRMPERNYVSWATMISGYATQRMVVEAMGIFESTCREDKSVNEFARMALRLIYEDDLLSSWGSEDCCKWRGVSCSNPTGQVVKLQLNFETPLKVS
ncbi:hypothetical protein Q3G72_003959 [Acer saccharum]|nr:hypothetical protein Q3G72_003959 [Acer saccharum]